MKGTTQLVAALALGVVLVNLAAADTWTRKTDMPTARRCCAASEADGKIYVVGGWDSWKDTTPLSTVEMYDPATDTWERKADMPTPRGALATVVLDGKIYAIGGARGESPFSTVEVYDPATDTWEAGVSMSTGRWFHSAVVLEGRIYVIGGVFSSTIEDYDPDTGIWRRKASMSTDRWVSGAGVVNNRIYVTGGDTSQGQTASVLEYDPITDSWTQKADMPAERCAHGVVVMHNRIYCVAGGVGTGSGPETPGPPITVWIYDPATDTWETRSDVRTPREDAGVATANGKIYVFGGFSDRICSTVEEYTPSPIVDFNGDYLIDIRDLLIMIEHWGGDEPALDIAPLHSGDGIIDAQDLEILMSYWGQELDDPTLLAHWALDETEGFVAHDSAGDHDATVVGFPAWQPAAGIVGGALQFDGATLLVTDCVLDPADGALSVLAWVKGGASGQVIVAQETGANWLCLDPASGALKTELKGAGRFTGTLCSETMVGDGDWHRVALVWERENRTLYVDDNIVAQDAQAGGPAACSGGLNIGCGVNMAPDSFWTGLIDDVRIYNRAVRP